MHIQTKLISPTSQGFPILLFQSPSSRAINVGFLKTENDKKNFIPARLNFGANRIINTLKATVETLNTSFVQEMLKNYKPEEISTLSIMREALACNLPLAFESANINMHYGDAFIGAMHIKGKGEIKTDYKYENTEGLIKNGLWILADSVCMGRSLIPTFNSLFSKKLIPKEIVFIMPIGSRLGIESFSPTLKENGVKASFISWGALFGVGENKYDMPWGHIDTQALDSRDQEVFTKMYGDKLCVGGDFGNNYYSPYLAQKFYEDQIKELNIKPNIPKADEILKIYKEEELKIC